MKKILLLLFVCTVSTHTMAQKNKAKKAEQPTQTELSVNCTALLAPPLPPIPPVPPLPPEPPVSAIPPAPPATPAPPAPPAAPIKKESESL